MKKEIAHKWAAALRSGEYQQGTGYLRSITEGKEPSYCCLGVLCDIAVKNEVIPSPTQITDFLFNVSLYLYDKESRMLPNSVQNWAGLRTYDGHLEYNGKHIYLWKLNDCRRMSFNQIADVIEEKWESL